MNCELLALREIFENNRVSQRDISKALGVALGKTNIIMKEIEDRGFIEKKRDKGYDVTKKGQSELRKHTVDKALILACGKGVRLQPLTFDIPKGFVKINGKPMIERQIEQLKEVGINDITIMVGYLKEKFDYLIDKYNVKLVYNEEYQDKNTLATLYHARDIIKESDVYICVSDVYMEKNLFHKYEFEPFYSAGFLKDVKNEWQFVTNKKKQILGIIEGGENAYCLMGHVFMTKEFSKEFLKLVESYYQMPQTNNFYWEDVYVRNIELLPPMFAYQREEGAIREFDSLEDIREYDPTYNESGSFQFKFVAQTFNVGEKDIKEIDCIKAGMTNHSYKFKINGINDMRYICRVPGINTAEFINRKNEYEVYNLLKGRNITEEVIAFDEEKGYKISKYYEDARTCDASNEDDLKIAMGIYKKLHNMEIVAKIESNDIIEMIERYMDVIEKNNIQINYEDFDKVYDEAKELMDYVRRFNRPKILTTGDANPGNVLFTKEGIKLIDFEYGGLTDPLTDVALFSSFLDYDVDDIYKLIDYYLESDGDNEFILFNIDEEIAKKLVLCYVGLCDLYNVVWVICRAGLSNADYGYYGMKKYRHFKDLYKFMKAKKILDDEKE